MATKHLLAAVLKWLAFAFCFAGFIWKTSDSFMSYYSQDIGTKIELRQNYESDLPAFAICRQASKIFEDAWLMEQFNISGRDMKTLKSYEIAEDLNISMVELYQFSLLNDSDYIRRLSVIQQGQHGGNSEPSLISSPQEHPQHWRAVYHPLYGICNHFEYADFIENITGKASVEFVKIYLNFTSAYEPFSLPKEITPFHISFDELEAQEEHAEEEEEDLNTSKLTIQIHVYEKGSFLSSRQLTQLRREESKKLYMLDEEIIDRSKTSNIFGCENDPSYVEDVCLMNCLVTKHISEFGCLHIRLFWAANESIKSSYNLCSLRDLAEKKANGVSLVPAQTRLMMRKNGRRLERGEDFGLVRIKSLLGDFYQAYPESRCACATPCQRKNIRVSKWPTSSSSSSSSQTNAKRQGQMQQRTYVAFHLQPTLKIYSYHVLYSGTDLVADIGGYLGLFLGLSVFGIMQLLSDLMKSEKPVGVVDIAKQTTLIMRDSMRITNML